MQRGLWTPYLSSAQRKTQDTKVVKTTNFLPQIELTQKNNSVESGIFRSIHALNTSNQGLMEACKSEEVEGWFHFMKGACSEWVSAFGVDTADWKIFK